MSYKTLHRHKNPLKSSGELRYSGMVSISSWDGGTGQHTNQSICIYLQFPHSLFISSFRLVQFRYITRKFGLVNGVLRHFQQFVNYFVEASYIGVWNWNTQGKPPAASHWQNFITLCCIEYTSPTNTRHRTKMNKNKWQLKARKT